MPGRARPGFAGWFLSRVCVTVLTALVLSLPLAWAEEDPLAKAIGLVELGTTYVEIGTNSGNAKKVAAGLARYREAQALYRTALTQPDLTPSRRNRIKAHLADVDSRIAWYAGDDTQDGGAEEAGEVRVLEAKTGEGLGTWCRRVLKLYDETQDPREQAALARGLASHAGVSALPSLFRLFERERDERARQGVHEALARIGTSKVANKMASFARKNAEKHWQHALAVTYRCLAKSEASEPEAPFLRSIRAFHKLRNPALTSQILKALDAMDPAGTAALGEVLYLPDFGYHDPASEMLGTKQDRRAAPALLHKTSRFHGQSRLQTPAYKALIQLGWYAVPGLLARMEERVVASWIFEALRQISAQALPPDKQGWLTWWKAERVRHPELFDGPNKPRADGQPAAGTVRDKK